MASTPGKNEAFEKGLDESLGTNFSMLLHNGAMGVGVEYTLKHVDKRYMLVNYNVIPADGYLQMLGRVRNPKETTVELFIQNPERKKDRWLPTTRDCVLKDIEAEREANNYIKKYFDYYLDPSTRRIQWVAETVGSRSTHCQQDSQKQIN